MLKKEEMAKIKKIYINQLRLSQHDNTEMLNYMAEHAVRRVKIKTIDDIIKETKKVTVVSLQKTINHIFRKSNLNLVLFGYFKPRQKTKIINRLDDWYYNT